MFRAILFNKREEIIEFSDHETLEKAIQTLNLSIDSNRDKQLKDANIYKLLDPGVNFSMKLIVSLRLFK